MHDSGPDLLAPFRATPVHLYVLDRVLLEQLRVIFRALKFTNVTEHKVHTSYMESAQQLARLIMLEDGVFLVNPPRTLRRQSAKGPAQRDLPDYFSSVSLLVAKARKDVMRTLSKCVPIFADAQYAQKREQTLLSLYKYGISGAFILKKQEPLGSMAPQLKKLRMEEQVMERYSEVREYLEGYLPYREDALSVLMEKKEERELSQRKAEAEKLLGEGREAASRGEFDRAITAYKKAIDLMPGEPSAYMESGRVYVRVKMYPQALYRFRQAEEVSKAIPEPNKEIGNVRILQVKERVARGESPTSGEIMHLLDEAVQNFSAALEKAETLSPLHKDDDRQRNAEAVSRIAGELLKLNLSGVLGKRHPKVRELGMLARDSFTRVAGDDVASLQPDQLLFLGLAALDEGDFAAAEEHFFKAAESRDHFADACVEINYLGTVLRKRAGAKEAIEVYERLLSLDPPNRAAVNFNVSVAYVVEKRELDGAAAIVRAVFADPELPKNDLFYKNTQIYETLRTVVRLFARASRLGATAMPPQDVVKARQIQDRLERAVSSKNAAEAFRLTALIGAKMPGFFEREHVQASKRIMRYVRTKAQELSASSKPDMARLGEILAQAADKEKGRVVPKRLIAHTDFRRQASELLEQGEERAKAAGFMAKALVCHPEYIEAPEFYTDQELNTLVRDTAERLKNVDMDKIEHFYKLYGLEEGAKKPAKPRAKTRITGNSGSQS